MNFNIKIGKIWQKHFVKLEYFLVLVKHFMGTQYRIWWKNSRLGCVKKNVEVATENVDENPSSSKLSILQCHFIGIRLYWTKRLLSSTKSLIFYGKSFRTVFSLDEVITIGRQNLVIWHLANASFGATWKKNVYADNPPSIQDLKDRIRKANEDMKQKLCNLVMKSFINGI